jgi:hypothetical protein
MVLVTTEMLRKLPVGQMRGHWECWPKKLIWRYSIGADLALSPVDVLSARCVQSLLLSFSRSFVLFSTFLCDRFSLCLSPEFAPSAIGGGSSGVFPHWSDKSITGQGRLAGWCLQSFHQVRLQSFHKFSVFLATSVSVREIRNRTNGCLCGESSSTYPT